MDTAFRATPLHQDLCFTGNRVAALVVFIIVGGFATTRTSHRVSFFANKNGRNRTWTHANAIDDEPHNSIADILNARAAYYTVSNDAMGVAVLN